MIPDALVARSPRLGDAPTIYVVQALRAFGYGLFSVILALSLSEARLKPVLTGLIFASVVAGMAVTSVVTARIADRVGRRSLYGLLLVVMAGAAALAASTAAVPLLVIAGLTGCLSLEPNESGPITSLEQAMLGHVPRSRLAQTFGRYNAVAYLAGAAGSLAATAPQFLTRRRILDFPVQRSIFVVSGLAIVAFLVSRALSPAVEVSDGDRAASADAPVPPRIRLLAGLFAVDSLGGGFVVQSFLVYWFIRKFGSGTETLGAVFAAAGLLQAASSIAAGWVADRIGYLNTMLLSHIPANILLLLLPFAPTLGMAIAILLVRFALSQMDVPARQAFVVAMAPGTYRTRATAYTNTARYLTRPVGTALAGASMQALGTGAPLAIAGLLKLAYDGLLLAGFRGSRPEQRAQPPREERASS